MNNVHWLLPEGIDELLPPKALLLEKKRRDLLDLFNSWGYDLIQPPFIEYLESLLTGTGGDLDLRTFKITDQVTGRTLGIRADITPQAARIDAHQLRRDAPTRLCYVGTVLNTRTDGFAGSRSPVQIGAELYGHAGEESDQEILCLMLETLEKAGVENVYIDLGHVGIFRALAEESGLNKQQELELFDALQRKAVPEITVLLASYNLTPEHHLRLSSLASLSGDDALVRAQELLSGAGESVQSALKQMERLSNLLAEQRPDVPVHFDLAELRGYHYHTGVVFAAFVPELGQEIARGGRYDDIGQLFGRARPACGFSADLKMLMRLANSENLVEQVGIFAPSDDDPVLRQRIRELRAEGRRVIVALPGQKGDASSMSCGEALEKQGVEWVVKPL
ncbi:ATP phosphoribosyltransferase regulatory subunit [Sedimenticola selenatireducens]|uniref:ATP phosphoribosyltransferase regulatory subunit n=1 Tax=Sedimenticola selenatireducens TaxID=191960 RepID=A0A558DS61_9GAMM|nr:ATP phosphoribosyltransferase regulatory subunit [Sedimenticola selenatireducens]TVO75971.1 ATP phosphoribosyltransferase regulatory subunit [Sedimenticola selenatireducens]TVT63829.1 MAG: ATP phosphoribosyltransferase regulatory subunit [Sedimenticola selenatireducens]